MRFRWKVELPIIQLVLALCLWVYVPFEFTHEMLRRMKLSPQEVVGRRIDVAPEVWQLYFPPRAGQVLYAINYPAYAASNAVQRAVRWRQTPAIHYTVEDPSSHLPEGYVIGVRELTFFTGVCILWFWAGTRIDELVQGKPYGRKPRWPALRGIEVICACAFGVLLLKTCTSSLMAKNWTPPDRTIATFALIWPVLFLVDSYWILKRMRGVTNAQDLPR